MRFLVLAMVVGCTVDGLELEGRECPCIEGWRCDDARNVCVREDDAGVADGGVDAADGSVDAGRVDSGGDDAGEDAGGDDAGDDDGGPTDAGVDAPPIDATPPRSTECDDLDVILCEGFEDDLSGWALDIPTGTETEVVYGPDALRGRGMLRSYSDGRGDQYSVIHHDVWDDAATDLWVRVNYRLDPVLNTVTEAFEIFNTGYDYSIPYLANPGSGSNIHAHGIFDDEGWGASHVPDAGVWYCAEMHMHRDPTAGYMEVFIDGSSVVRTEDLAIPEPFHELAVGMVYGEDEGVVYIDEVAADTARIPCP